MALDYQTFIVAIDGSQASDKAVQRSLNIVKNNSALLILTHIIDYRIFFTDGTYDKVLAEQTEKNANELIDQYIKKAQFARIRLKNASSMVLQKQKLLKRLHQTSKLI